MLSRFLVLALFCGNAFAITPGTAAWFANNWFGQKPTTVAEEKPVVSPVGMDEYVATCTELTNNPSFCKTNWFEAKMSGSEIYLVAGDREVKTTKVTQRQTVQREPKVSQVKTKPLSQVKGVNLLDVDNVEYKERRASALAKPNAVVFRETIR